MLFNIVVGDIFKCWHLYDILTQKTYFLHYYTPAYILVKYPSSHFAEGSIVVKCATKV